LTFHAARPVDGEQIALPPGQSFAFNNNKIAAAYLVLRVIGEIQK